MCPFLHWIILIIPPHQVVRGDERIPWLDLGEKIPVHSALNPSSALSRHRRSWINNPTEVMDDTLLWHRDEPSRCWCSACSHGWPPSHQVVRGSFENGGLGDERFPDWDRAGPHQGEGVKC